ncbi:MAG: 30S ribosomal protein S12 methylthiotransferase RimO [Planctomycetes bacterium]|nr:30S ribosomal protein S12 methylthiotransferase RimO [Planctomycetota bacterium]
MASRSKPKPNPRPAPKEAERPVVSMVNLGCAKNLVDSERILGRLAEQGFLIAQDPAVADLCLVNTCGFIQEAREETAGVLRELSELKSGGSLKTLVALGCLVERVADAPELNRFLEHADARLGFKDFVELPRILQEIHAANEAGRYAGATRSYAEGPTQSAAKKKVPSSYNDFLVAPRMRIGSPHHAYLKISEGCNNPCKFCAIPRMRGLQVSRPIEDLVVEANALVEGGAAEISLVAQDTTSYGQDIYGKHRLADLLRAIRDGVAADVWLRLMYAYPKHLDAEMLDVLASDTRFCPYIDMPLQQISDPMLSAMGRGVTKAQTEKLLDLVAKKLPHGAIRTTFIVGFPGESEKDFAELLAFVEEGRFTHAGVFLYSTEPLTPAAKLAETVSLAEKQRRREAIMLTQREVAKKRLKERKGATIEVLVDGALEKNSGVPKGAKAAGRSQLEAFEVDGTVFLSGPGTRKLAPGTRVTAKVTRTLDYDLVAEVVR